MRPVAQRHLREVERLARKAAEARAALIAAIMAAYESGETYSDIARAAGLTRQRIAQIVAARQAVLDENPAIKKAYFSVAD
ncbi:MAG: hypothetical protein C4289_09310, partial [Chloroflexota bacterium]